uniref:caspase family protein n=1 Tax=Ensifer adhaerens TaxID=106592 RepID=UPI003F490C37
MTERTARVFDDGVRDKARTHVFIIGVGNYLYGEGDSSTLVAGGLAQLTSPPKSASAIAHWFLDGFHNPGQPLGTVTMLVSGQATAEFKGQELPEATLSNVKKAMLEWRRDFEGHPDNMLVFYFCGHGISFGQKAALLLSDFGSDESAYDAAIDLDTLRGTLKNALPGKQLFLIDCCRSRADSLYLHEATIGSRVLSIPAGSRPGGTIAKQCVLFPTLDGEQAFGVPDEVSVFTSCFLDAVNFAGFDNATGTWVSSTMLIVNAIEQLVGCRLSLAMRNRTVPTALEAANFEFNHIAEPQKARSFVTIDDTATWPTATFTATERGGAGRPAQSRTSSEADTYRCCVFELDFGNWEFSGDPNTKPPSIVSEQRNLQRPVAYVKLGVTP